MPNAIDAQTQEIELESQTSNLSESPQANSSNLWGTLLYGLGASVPATATGALFGYIVGGVVGMYLECADETNRTEEALCGYSSATSAMGAAIGATAATTLSGFFASRHAHREEKSGFCQGAQDSINYIGEQLQYCNT